MRFTTRCSFKQKLRVYTNPFKFGVKLGFKLITQPRNNDTGKWIRTNLINLGPTYIKIGQVVSSRPDLFPTYITDELISLQTNVPSIPYDDVKNVIEEEYSANIEQVFYKINKTPIASASIGQVHLAKLKTNHKLVVVKVQKPNIEETILNELSVIENLLLFFKIFKVKQINDLLIVLNDSCLNIKAELDFINEKNNTIMFQGLYKNTSDIRIPRVYSKLTTKKVLVMEYLPGIKIDTIPEHMDPDTISKKLMTNFIMCLLRYGYLHADPHAGNISISEDNKIILYDFGIIAKYDINIKVAFKDIFIAFLSKDTDVVINRVLQNDIIIMKRERIRNVKELNSIEYIVLFRLVNYLFEYSETLNIQDFERNIRSDSFLNINNLPFTVNPEMLLLFKTFTTLEGVCKKINDEFNYFLLLDDLVNEFMDVNILTQKITNDIQLIMSQFNNNSDNNDLSNKVQSARMEQIDTDASNRYKVLMIAMVVSTIVSILG